MAVPKKEKKCEKGSPKWLLSWGDLTTLLLTFFVMMYDTGSIDQVELQIVLSQFQGQGAQVGGNTLSKGKLAELGNTIASLPSTEKGTSLAKAKLAATSIFQPELKTKKVRVKEDERGLVISLASDAFFKQGSAEILIEDSRAMLQNLAQLLNSPEFGSRKFRIEGHTDSLPTDPNGKYPTNWELSSSRSANVLHYLVDFGVKESQFQVVGLADTVPLATNDTEDGRAYNRRVDVIILAEGHL